MTTAMNMIDQIRAADGIFASNQTSAEGLLLALRQNNLAGKIKFVGFDSSPLLDRGPARRRNRRIGRAESGQHGLHSVKLMVDHLHGREIEPVVNTSVHLVTLENMDDAEIAPLLK